MKQRELDVSIAATSMENCVKFYAHWEQEDYEFYIYENCNAGDL